MLNFFTGGLLTKKKKKTYQKDLKFPLLKSNGCGPSFFECKSS